MPTSIKIAFIACFTMMFCASAFAAPGANSGQPKPCKKYHDICKAAPYSLKSGTPKMTTCVSFEAGKASDTACRDFVFSKSN